MHILLPITDAKYQHFTFTRSIYPAYFTLACLSIEHYDQALIYVELS